MNIGRLGAASGHVAMGGIWDEEAGPQLSMPALGPVNLIVSFGLALSFCI